MPIKQRKIFDAGVTNPTKLSQERNDGSVGESYVKTPRSGYSINETTNMVFTDSTLGNAILEGVAPRTVIADPGSVRPGTTK